MLCDFVFDKATRLFSKYEAMQHDRKLNQEEHSFQAVRQLEQVEKENEELKSTLLNVNQLVNDHMPRLSAVLGLEFSPESFDINGVLSIAEERLRELEHENAQLKDKMGKLV